jgi:enterochelin esterase-like enzyme
MVRRWIAGAAVFLAVQSLTAVGGATTLEPRPVVHGADVTSADLRGAGEGWRTVPWDDLDGRPLDPGEYELRLRVDGGPDGAAVQVPPCAGRGRVMLDGKVAAAPAGPVVLGLAPGMHELRVAVKVSKYERRIACGERPRVGSTAQSVEGLGLLTFDSPYGAAGGGRAVVYVPPGHDGARPAPLLVGVHPWNGSMWTYAAYAELLREARARDVLLLMPSGLGNSLYTADAEDEVMRAIDALAQRVAVDPRAVSMWGASMGGAGATTIGLHHPDRFASVTSFFGDSKYDLSTYVRGILPDEAAAHRVNALDVVDNARELPVWLIHGEDDATSPIRQSEMLARAMRERGFRVRFDRVPGMGHAGALVARFVAQVVDLAASARAPEHPARVTYRSVRPWDTGAYGVRIVRASPQGDALVDVERRDDAVHVLRAEGVRAVVLEPGALGTKMERPPRIVVDGSSGVQVRWEAGAEAGP